MDSERQLSIEDICNKLTPEHTQEHCISLSAYMSASDGELVDSRLQSHMTVACSVLSPDYHLIITCSVYHTPASLQLQFSNPAMIILAAKMRCVLSI